MPIPFNELASVQLTVALEAVHRALRVIRFRDGADHMLENLNRASDDEANRLALRILQGVESEAAGPIRTLSEDDAGRHIRNLSNLIEERTKSEWKYDEASGERALRELRHTA
ncbi:MAG TPA: hypothetical protein VFZ01_19985 [Geminicoccaceae bacterium]